MRIGVISDTHDRVERTRPAIDVFLAEGVERVLHCGDIGSRFIVELFDRWETHFVFGNTDYEQRALRECMEVAGHVCHGRYGEVTWAQRRIALLHGDDFKQWQQAIASQQFQMVCSGHTHQRSIETIGQTLVLNPGAIERVAVPSVAIVDLASLSVRHVDLPK